MPTTAEYIQATDDYEPPCWHATFDFYPPRTRQRGVLTNTTKYVLEQAQKACDSCLIKANCLELAISNGERYGIWGGVYMESDEELHKHLSRRDFERLQRERIKRNHGVRGFMD